MAPATRAKNVSSDTCQPYFVLSAANTRSTNAGSVMMRAFVSRQSPSGLPRTSLGAIRARRVPQPLHLAGFVRRVAVDFAIENREPDWRLHFGAALAEGGEVHVAVLREIQDVHRPALLEPPYPGRSGTSNSTNGCARGS